MTGLRDVLRAVRAAAPGTGPDDLARGLGLDRDELAAMIDYWVRRGELTVEELAGCPPTGCAGCPAAGGGWRVCPGRPAERGPTLLAIRTASGPAGRPA